MLSRYLFTVVGLLLLCSNNAQTCSNGIAGVEGFSMCCVAECGICGGDPKAGRGCLPNPRRLLCDEYRGFWYETCSNGLSGVEGYGMCCDAEWGTCGGFECHERAEAALLTPDDCCVQNIRASGVHCDDSQSAPCIIGGINETTCRNGLIGVENSAVCCNAECGTCGGKKCHVQAREAALTPDDCCATNIIASGVYCDDSQSAPCIMGVNSNETCSNGLSGVEGFGMCCNADCETCGGDNCNRRAVEAVLTPDECCATNIRASGVYCEDSQSAPCIMAKTCSNGLHGVEDFGICCTAECGICGIEECHTQARLFGLTPDDCCVTNIRASGVYCDDSQSAPCIVGGNNETCSNGLSGIEGFGMCCHAECGTCGGEGCPERARLAALTLDDCCVQHIKGTGVYCEDSQSAPCIMAKTCSNGLDGVEDYGICCTAECGICGGDECHTQARLRYGLTPDDCCATNIRASGVYCDDSQSAPCIVGGNNETCSNGLSGVEGFGMCCHAECGTCGGEGCPERARLAALTLDDCCVQHIRASGLYCDDSQSAPCIIGGSDD